MSVIVAQDSGTEDQVVTARIQVNRGVGAGAIRSRKPDLYRRSRQVDGGPGESSMPMIDSQHPLLSLQAHLV